RPASRRVGCYNRVAVLVTPEAQGQATARRGAVIAERPRLSSARCEHDHGCSARRMEPVGLIRVCLRNYIVARSRQVAPSDAASLGSNVGLQWRNAAIQRTDTEPPAGQWGFARILDTVCVFVVILANGDRTRAAAAAAAARVIRSCHAAIAVERRRVQVAFVAARSAAHIILSEHTRARLIGRQTVRFYRAI